MQPEPQRRGDPGCPLSLAPNQFLEEGLSREVCLLAPPAAPEARGPSPALVSLFLLLREAKESGVNSLGMRAALPWA